MSKEVKTVNSFFREATKKNVDDLLSAIILTERQNKIFDMFYIKGNDINYIADSLYVCPTVINVELKIIRSKILKSL